ncbi:MAG: DsbE family thiol:disulfide interchange protein [Hyphomicrobiaceae bacterium]
MSEATPQNVHAKPQAGGGGPAGQRRRHLGLLLAPALLFGALAGLFFFALQKGDPSKIPSALIGKPAPQFTLAAVEGMMEGGRPVATFQRADLAAGTPTVVNFWASWCLPCVDEHPLLLELKKRAGINIVGVNYKDQPANARRFLSRYGNPFSAVGADPAGKAAIEWGVYGMPETFVVDGRGTIVYKHVGPISPEALETRILPAIAAARAVR